MHVLRTFEQARALLIGGFVTFQGGVIRTRVVLGLNVVARAAVDFGSKYGDS